MTMTESFKKLFGVVNQIRAGRMTMNEGRKIMGLDPLPSSSYIERPGDFTPLVKERVDSMKVKYKCLNCDWRFTASGQKDGITCLACGGPTIALSPNEDDRPRGVRPPSMFKIPQDTSIKIQYLDRLTTLATNYELSSDLLVDFAARAVKVCNSIEEDLDIGKDEGHVEI
jgi:hypothetical protein